MTSEITKKIDNLPLGEDYGWKESFGVVSGSTPDSTEITSVIPIP